MTEFPVATRLRELLVSGAFDVPMPGSGETWRRFEALMSLSREEVALGRLAEAHLDAVAILRAAGNDCAQDRLLGVWAADFEGSRIEARRRGDGWVLRGQRAWCSGAGLLDGALVTARTDDGSRLFLVDLGAPGVEPDPSTWATPALAGTTTWTVHFDEVNLAAADAIGPPGFYTDRPGFWHGSVGVAAAWAGGAEGLADDLVQRSRDDPVAVVHVGDVHAASWCLRAVLRTAAAEIDADPGDRCGTGMIRALTVRHLVERTIVGIIDRCGRALGASPLALDVSHARRVADLGLYVRQHHADHDLALIGREVKRARSDPR
jgi:alkylation response protein AidB-like acyl-CoA dehydrogenase